MSYNNRSISLKADLIGEILFDIQQSSEITLTVDWNATF